MDDPTRLDDLVQAYLNGTSSGQELADLQAELRANPAAAEAFAEAARLHVALSVELREARRIGETAEGFAAVENSVRGPAVVRTSAFRRQEIGNAPASRLKVGHRTWWLAAGVLVVGLCAAIALNWKTGPTVLSGSVLVDGKAGERIRAGAVVSNAGAEPATLQLADRSTMVLKPQSEATLNGAQNGYREVVALHKGSAHFTVEKGGGKFIVNTAAGNVTVLGTEFDMELRPADNSENEEQRVGKKAAWVLAVAVFAGTVNVDFDGQTHQLTVGENRVFGEEQIAHVGEGSYRLTRPQPCKALPEKVHKTEAVKGPPITHQWWSSLLWQQKKFGQPLFAHPLVATCSEGGLAIGYPGANVHGNKDGIFGGGVGKEGDLKIDLSSSTPFRQVDCDGYSDWFVSALFTNGEQTLRTSFGHGSPFVYCTYNGIAPPIVTFPAPPQVWSGGEKDAVLGITIAGHHYGLFGPTGSNWSGLGSKLFRNNATDKNYFSVALLPDNRPETLALFRKVAYNHVTDTKVEYKIDGGVVKTAYRMSFKAYEGAETAGTITALYPHQWKNAVTKLTDMTYGSIRGTMKVCAGESFATEVPIEGLLPLFPSEGVQDKQRMIGYLKAEAAKKPGGFADTYWEGKYLGRLATLSGIAEAAGDAGLQKTFVDEIKRRLENWFTATAEKDKPVFYYNATWGSLIGSPPSYGSDMPLNDHHFHYGYFIRAAAEAARVDGAWAKKWGPMVKLIIRDIASSERSDPLFPYLRCFDKYAGHSWASGDANFADGNNQESSSESLNAWYGMALWGQATGDAAVRDTGLFLYNTERTAIEEYWFDVSGTNFPKDHPNVALGMIWGGKGAFATWFSGDIDCIHGINWLPFTPSSLYMGRHPDYVKKNFDRIVEKRKAGQDFNTGWGDLVAMFGALNDPASAAKYIDAHPDCKLEGGNSHAFMYHWIYTLNNLGRNDAGVTADYPIYDVFRKDGVNTYVVYNYNDAPLTVKFSDGKVVQSKGKGLTVVAK